MRPRKKHNDHWCSLLTIKTIPFKLVFRVVQLCSDFVTDKINIAHFAVAVWLCGWVLMFASRLMLMGFFAVVHSFIIIVALRLSLSNSNVDYIMNNTVELMTTYLHTNTTFAYNRIIRTAVEIARALINSHTHTFKHFISLSHPFYFHICVCLRCFQ